MYEENPIGKKVNLLVEADKYEMRMTDEVCEVVKVVPWSEELNDWCQHYIVRKPDGSEVEIREVDCVYTPNDTLSTEARIHQFLDDNGVWADVWTENGIAVVVGISWGDWKHEHLWAKTLMRYLGYGELGCKVTEEDGSDCYSADHYFVKTA